MQTLQKLGDSRSIDKERQMIEREPSVNALAVC